MFLQQNGVTVANLLNSQFQAHGLTGGDIQAKIISDEGYLLEIDPLGPHVCLFKM